MQVEASGEVMTVRVIIKAFFAMLFVFSLLIIVRAIFVPAQGSEATITASLAVIAAVLTGWGAQKVVEHQENAIMPYPYPFFDLTSRHGNVQLALKNWGGGPAFDIHMKLDKPIFLKKKQVEFDLKIPVLFQGKQLMFRVGAFQEFPENPKPEYSGIVTYRSRVNGPVKRIPFTIGLDGWEMSFTRQDELNVTLHKLQELPEQLKRIADEVHSANSWSERTPIRPAEETRLETND